MFFTNNLSTQKEIKFLTYFCIFFLLDLFKRFCLFFWNLFLVMIKISLPACVVIAFVRWLMWYSKHGLNPSRLISMAQHMCYFCGVSCAAVLRNNWLFWWSHYTPWLLIFCVVLVHFMQRVRCLAQWHVATLTLKWFTHSCVISNPCNIPQNTSLMCLKQ